MCFTLFLYFFFSLNCHTASHTSGYPPPRGFALSRDFVLILSFTCCTVIYMCLPCCTFSCFDNMSPMAVDCCTWQLTEFVLTHCCFDYLFLFLNHQSLTLFYTRFKGVCHHNNTTVAMQPLNCPPPLWRGGM